jgi:hypothetical protein
MTAIQHDADQDIGVEQAEEFAREHPGLVKLARVGWVAKGVVYVLIGMLAFVIVFDSGPATETTEPDQEASLGGAISKIAETSGGAFLLVVIAIGLVIYSTWRIVSALLPADNDLESWLNRAGYLVSAATYLVVAWTALSLARAPGNSQESEDSKVESFTADLLGKSYGQTLVFVVGAILIVIAAAFLRKAITANFASQMAARGVGPVSHRALVRMGRVGWLGRSAMMGLVGFFLCRAAVLFDSDEAQGLDGSLRHAATSGVGTALVLVVAVGLVVYGAFCVISAPRQLLVPADR